MAGPTLPQIGTKNYENLSYKDKLFVLNLYLFDKDKYRILTEYGPVVPEFYFDRKIATLSRNGRIGTPNDVDSCLISIHKGYWGVYLCNYREKFFEEHGLSPLEDFGIFHERIIGLNLFTFPVLRTDFVGKTILHWINASGGSIAVDTLFYLLSTRCAVDSIVNLDHRVRLGVKMNEREIRRKRKQGVFGYGEDPIIPNELEGIASGVLKDWASSGFDYSLESVLTRFEGKIRYSDLFPGIEENDLVLPSVCRRVGRWWLVPVVPAALYEDRNFSVKAWDFLTVD